MKKTIKNIAMLLCTSILILLATTKSFAADIIDLEYSEEFQEWLKLSDEEKQNVMMPMMYDFENTKTEYKNPLYLTRMLDFSLNPRYSLKDEIPLNLTIKDQQKTNSCWTFAALSSLETNLALANLRNGINTSKVYDFSERHMNYATSRKFLNNQENLTGYNREPKDYCSWWTAETYLVNGTGAIPESEMPFKNNEDIIDISEIQNKTISSQVYDTIYFEKYRDSTGELNIEKINKIKQHIKNYGSVYAPIHSSPLNYLESKIACYNNKTGARYCNELKNHGSNHAVSIIGWDDEYKKENFSVNCRPSSDGAWIARNSLGEIIERDPLELKQSYYDNLTTHCIKNGWTEPSLIPNSAIAEFGYTYDEKKDIFYTIVGDYGIIYISYEDVNVSGNKLYGIIKASDFVDYDNIYQYDQYYPAMAIGCKNSEIMLGNIFEKDSSTEYLTQVSIFAPEKYTCRVYVNPNGSSFAKEDLQLVSLKAGESETFDVGYHTLEFSNPIALTGNKFAVVIEITSAKDNTNILLETRIDSVETFDVVKVEKEKCFLANGHDLEKCVWQDLGANDSLCGDSTIKAFTTNELIDESLINIEITTPPAKLSYFEGENFDKTGMVVMANYNSKRNPSIVLDSSSYSISGGTNLQEGQTSVTITYEDKNVNQAITVEKNSITELKITTPPTKTEYKEGQNFDTTGMVIEAIRKNGEREIVTDYKIQNGNNLKADQTKVTIFYEGKTVEQKITVISNSLVEIKVDKAPNKTNYIIGQDFDKTGMVILGVYQDGTTVEIHDYIVENSNNLSKEQTSVTISYLGKTTNQNITVVEKNITGISINKKPEKLTYIQNKEDLDLSGGSIIITYNDESTEIINMTSTQVNITGFDNKKIGKVTITLEYQSQTETLEVEIIEEEKAKNSNLLNAKSDIIGIRAYYFTNKSQENYTLIDVEVNNIERSLNNDSVEYYYYLSTEKGKENIIDWVKITEEQSSRDKLIFTINSKDLVNYEDISKENILYIYIKEVTKKGGDQSVAITDSISLEANGKVDTYVDNQKKENINSSDNSNNNNGENVDKDTTIAGDHKLPQTGIKAVAFIVFIVMLIGGAYYLKYIKLRDLK